MMSNDGPTNVDINYAWNTTEKLAPTKHEVHHYPHFSGAERMHGRTQSFRDAASVGVATTGAKKRTLSILDK